MREPYVVKIVRETAAAIIIEESGISLPKSQIEIDGFEYGTIGNLFGEEMPVTIEVIIPNWLAEDREMV